MSISGDWKTWTSSLASVALVTTSLSQEHCKNYVATLFAPSGTLQFWERGVNWLYLSSHKIYRFDYPKETLLPWYIWRFHCGINNNKSMPNEWKSIIIKEICLCSETVWVARGSHNEDVTIFIYKLLAQVVLYYTITLLL